MLDDLKPKILVVEDDSAIRELINLFLVKSGFESFTAISAEDGIDILIVDQCNLELGRNAIGQEPVQGRLGRCRARGMGWRNYRDVGRIIARPPRATAHPCRRRAA
jgi:hypothetical protein